MRIRAYDHKVSAFIISIARDTTVAFIAIKDTRRLRETFNVVASVASGDINFNFLFFFWRPANYVTSLCYCFMANKRTMIMIIRSC